MKRELQTLFAIAVGTVIALAVGGIVLTAGLVRGERGLGIVMLSASLLALVPVRRIARWRSREPAASRNLAEIDRSERKSVGYTRLRLVMLVPLALAALVGYAAGGVGVAVILALAVGAVTVLAATAPPLAPLSESRTVQLARRLRPRKEDSH